MEKQSVYRKIELDDIDGRDLSTLMEYIWEEVDRWLDLMGFTREDMLTDPHVDLDTKNYSYDPNDYPALYVVFETLETDEEVRERIQREQNREDIERRQYEALKAKFEGEAE